MTEQNLDAAFSLQSRTDQSSARGFHLRNRHEAMIDFLILNPHLSTSEAAAACHVSDEWWRAICKSDVFRDRLERRRREHSANLSLHIHNRLSAVTETVLNTIAERLTTFCDKPEKLTNDDVRLMAELLLTAIGVLAPKGVPAAALSGAGAPTFNFHIDSADLLRARDRMGALTLNNDDSSAKRLPAPTGLQGG